MAVRRAMQGVFVTRHVRASTGDLQRRRRRLRWPRDNGFNLSSDEDNCGRCGMQCNERRGEMCCRGLCAPSVRSRSPTRDRRRGAARLRVSVNFFAQHVAFLDSWPT
jgi:hypothetical protein